jgi:hypothetical protein
VESNAKGGAQANVRWALFMTALVSCLIAIFAMAVINRSDTPEEAEARRKIDQEMASDRKINDDRLRMAVVGALRLKEGMRDPDSFVLEDVVASADGTHACYDYRARNGFGGMNREHAFAYPALGVVMTSGNKGFAAAWNRECTHAGMIGMKDEVEFSLSRIRK